MTLALHGDQKETSETALSAEIARLPQEGRGDVNVTAIAVTRHKNPSSSEGFFARTGAAMNPVSPRLMLAEALRRVAVSPAAAIEIADRAGNDLRRAVQRARSGKAVNAGAHLALCGAVGIDPVDGSPRPVKRVPRCVAWPVIAGELKRVRLLRRFDQRSAARVIGISASSICRVEAGNDVSVATLVQVCRFIEVHPDDYAT
jgi:DNA-binding Xre family transcriptional regulator